MTEQRVREKHVPKVGFNGLTSMYVLQCRCEEFQAQDYSITEAAECFDAHINDQIALLCPR